MYDNSQLIVPPFSYPTSCRASHWPIYWDNWTKMMMMNFRNSRFALIVFLIKFTNVLEKEGRLLEGRNKGFSWRIFSQDVAVVIRFERQNYVHMMQLSFRFSTTYHFIKDLICPHIWTIERPMTCKPRRMYIHNTSRMWAWCSTSITYCSPLMPNDVAKHLVTCT